jgi:hypothetical protein
MTAAFLSITPVRKIRSCPAIIMKMSEPISPNTVKKEIAVGTLMAVSGFFLTGEHHHLITYKELEETITSETINIFSNMQYDKGSIIKKLYQLKKHKILIMMLIMPFVIRMAVFVGIQLLF